MIDFPPPAHEPDNLLLQQKVAAILAQAQANEITHEDGINQLEALQSRITDSLNQGRILYALGVLYDAVDHTLASGQAFDAARVLFEQNAAEAEIAHCDWYLGLLLEQRGKLEKARLHYKQAAETATRLGIFHLRQQATARDGLLSYKVGDLDRAQVSLHRAIRMMCNGWPRPFVTAPDQPLATLICEMHIALSGLMLRHNAPHMAWEHASDAHRIAEQLGDERFLGLSRRAIANVISHLGFSPDTHYADEPDIHYEAALRSLRAAQLPVEEAHTLYALGESLAKRRKNRSASTAFQQAMILYNRLGMPTHAARTAQAQIQLI